MNKTTTLPQEFAPLRNRINHVQQKVGGKEYSSSCPRCGGSIHSNNELPDRFCMWPVSDATGGPLGWCRRCDYKWFPDKEEDYHPPTPEEVAYNLREHEKRIEEEIRQREVALAEVRKQRKWIEYHSNLDKTTKRLWFSRGINDEFWINFWKLGYDPEYKLWKKEEEKWVNWWTSPTLVIPLFGIGWKANNIKHRLLKVPDNERKYHQEYYNAPQAPFICDPDMTEKNSLLLVEGEIKAMVTYVTLDDPKMQVIGLPSMCPESGVLDMLSGYDPIYFCPDPDAFGANGNGSPAGKVSKMLGLERVRIIQLPGKIDDLIVEKSLDKKTLKNLLKMGRRYKK